MLTFTHQFLLGPYDGTLGPRGAPHNSQLILPARPDRLDSPRRVAYVWCEATGAWVFAGWVRAKAGDHILSWSNEGDIVLDPFNGSGTTTKMAREMGRRYIGIDVNQDYCEIAKSRLSQQLLPLTA